MRSPGGSISGINPAALILHSGQYWLGICAPGLKHYLLIRQFLYRKNAFTGRNHTLVQGEITMNSKNSASPLSKTQISLVSFAIGLIMLFIPYLKDFGSVVPGITQYFSLMFYLGLLLVIVGYYLK